MSHEPRSAKRSPDLQAQSMRNCYRRGSYRPPMTLRTTTLAALFSLLTTAACGVGSRSDTPPTPTVETTMPTPASNAAMPTGSPATTPPITAQLQTATFALG